MSAAGNRVVFFGSPPFAVDVLAALCGAGAHVVGVVTQPDKPAGRGNELRSPAVKTFACEHGLAVVQPRKVRDGWLAGWLKACDADLAVVAAYGRILPPDVLAAPRLGCVNVHASLLPRWRGAAPIQRAVVAGDAETGVCLMQMDAGLDTGPVLARASLPIADDDTGQTVERKLAALGGRLLADHLVRLLAGRLIAVPQPADGVTLAPPLDKAEARLDWTRSARVLHCQVRGLQPWPGAMTHVAALGEDWKIAAEGLQRGDAQGEAGTLLGVDASLAWIACGQGSLGVARLQRPGRAWMAAAELLRGVRLQPGARIG
jgi:methionyl-tRNA formyltransferase